MSKYSVRKPITVLMGILIVIVLGVFSLTKLSLGLFPEMNLPYVVVVTPYAGASAETVVEEVTRVVESNVTSMNNFATVDSVSREHFSVVIVEFNEGTNMDTVLIDLRTKLDNITFPEGVTKPTIMKVSPDMLPVMTVSLSAEFPELSDEQEFIKTTQFINTELLDRFNAIPGVAEVSLTGAAEVVLQVNLDQQILAQKGYTNDQILKLIEEQNHNELVGISLDNGDICMLYLGNAITSIEEIKKLPLPLIVNGQNEVVTLEELAIEDGIRYVNNNSESYSKVNGKQTVTLSFQMQNGAVITDVTKAITNTLEAMKKEYNNLDYSVVLDQGEYINLAVGSVIENLIYGAILAILILFLFLHDYKPTLIVGLAIPISVIATFMCMYFVGINLNMLSMGGLALGIGMLVDNAIVVIENIYRLRKEGKSKTEAAIEGAKGVASAIVASTLTTIVVFVPVLFLGGTIRDVFSNMAYTISFSLGCSLIIALTMVPSMAAKMFTDPNHCPRCDCEIHGEDRECSNCGKKLKKVRTPKEKKPSKFMDYYENVIRWSLNHKLIVLSSVIVLFLLVVGLTFTKGFVLLPATDEGSISTTIVVSPEVEFKTVSKYTDNLVTNIREISKEIETVSASFGTSSGMMSMVSDSSDSGYKISLTVKLTEKHRTSTSQYATKVKETIENFDFDIISGMEKTDIVSFEVEEDNNTMTSLTATGVSIRVMGYNLEKMEEVANKLAEIISKVEGTKKVKSGVKGSQNNLKIYVNKENAAAVGLTEQDFIDSLDLIFKTTGLDSLANSNTLTLNFNGIEYELEIPSDMNVGGMSLASVLKLFGGYEDFLANFMVFDKKMLNKITEYGESIYTFLPVDAEGNIVDNPQNMKGLKLAILPTIYYDTVHDKIIKLSLPPTLEDMMKIQSGEYKSLKAMSKGSVLGDEDDPTAIAVVKRITGYSNISSDGKYRYFNVSCAVDKNYNITKVSNKVIQEVNHYLDSSEFDAYRDIVKVEFKGENEEIMETVKQMVIALAVGILLVYMIIAIQFQSLLYPFIILGTLPLAFTGGLLFILIFGMEFSVVAIMGLIVLVGVAVNNGIVLIDYINQLRAEGKTIRESCVEASKTRLRPILMTALTTIVALLFSALGLSSGSELLQPLAVTSIGGLLYATILTLIVIPVIYYGVNRKKARKEEEKIGVQEK